MTDLPSANKRIAERDRRIEEAKESARIQRRYERYMEMLRRHGHVHFVSSGDHRHER